MLPLQHEALDVGDLVWMGLVPVAARDAHQHEAAALALVLVRELRAELFNARDGQLDQLGE